MHEYDDEMPEGKPCEDWQIPQSLQIQAQEPERVFNLLKKISYNPARIDQNIQVVRDKLPFKRSIAKENHLLRRQIKRLERQKKEVQEKALALENQFQYRLQREVFFEMSKQSKTNSKDSNKPTTREEPE